MENQVNSLFRPLRQKLTIKLSIFATSPFRGGKGATASFFDTFQLYL